MKNMPDFINTTKVCKIQIIPILLTLIFLYILGISGCGRSDSSSGYEYAKWSFSGIVRDGLTHQPLVGASISYTDESGNKVEIFSDSSGSFYISSLPFGHRSFIFSYNTSAEQSDENNSTILYARRIIQAGSVTESQIEGVLANETETIDLYPLSGAVQGYVKIDRGGEYLPAAGISVEVSYNEPTFINDAPENFIAQTDSTGFFSLTDLPADSGISLTAGALNSDSSFYTPVSIDLPKLRGNTSLRISDILLDFESNPINIVSSSTWPGSQSYEPEISAFDTIRVVFSERLMSAQTIRWYDTESITSIMGGGTHPNATSIVNADTLLIVPDHRLNFEPGAELALKFSVQGISGNRSDTLQLFTRAREHSLYILHSNTVDRNGNSRLTLDPMDTLYFVLNRSIGAIEGLLSADSAKTPENFSINQFRIQNDTLLYIPQAPMPPNTPYSFWLVLLSDDPQPVSNAIQLNWQTSNGFYISSTNLQENQEPRKFSIAGDSIQITFSTAIDTSNDASIPFDIDLYDHQDHKLNFTLEWNEDLTTISLKNTQALALNNCAAWSTSSGPQAAVANIQIKATTLSGKTAINPAAPHELQAFTEEGLCPVFSNTIAPGQTPGAYIDTSVQTNQLFHADSSIRIRFNRALDTTAINNQNNYPFAQLIQSSDKDTVSAQILFSADAKELILQPDTSLASDEQYFIKLQNIPGLNISQGHAMDLHGGIFSGRTSKKYLTVQSFAIQ